MQSSAPLRPLARCRIFLLSHLRTGWSLPASYLHVVARLTSRGATFVYFAKRERLNENVGRTDAVHARYSDSDVFLSVEVPSRPVQKQNVKVNA